MSQNTKEIVTKEFRIDRLDHKGFATTSESKNFLQIWNALPGELVSVEFMKSKRFRKRSLVAKEIIEANPHRIEPVEKDHFLSCSPWQIVDQDEENKLKRNLTLRILKKHNIIISNELTQPIPLIMGTEQYSYRNKMEFSFYIDENEKIHLAFHKRGSKGIIPVDGCKLATDAINQTAKIIIDWINEVKFPKKILKTLIVRSNQKGETIAGLFVTDKNDNVILNSCGEHSRTMIQNPVSLNKLINNKFIGFSIYYSNCKCPASVADELLFQEGQNWLDEEIIIATMIENRRKQSLKYGLLSFFQINIPVFEKALESIHKEIPEGADVLDFYSGVGSISLPIAGTLKHLALVDNNEESIEFAKENIKNNKIGNAEAICLPAEKITELITSDKIIIVDPPRSGMNPKVIDKLVQELPEKIIYLSCNPESQAIDLERLQKKYRIKSMQIYNFFPRTPHIESLVILEKKICRMSLVKHKILWF